VTVAVVVVVIIIILVAGVAVAVAGTVMIRSVTAAWPHGTILSLSFSLNKDAYNSNSSNHHNSDASDKNNTP
jgi:hypothetical protein